MNSVKYLSKYVALFVGFLVITGCATNNAKLTPSADAGVNEPDAVIAQDFVNIMVQVASLAPETTVLAFGDEQDNPSERDARSIQTNNAFGKALRAAAVSGGYTMETANSPTATNYVSYSIAEFGDAVNGTTYTYDLSVGEIDFRRVYKALDNGRVEPFKAMMIRGADISELVTDDSLFTKPKNIGELAAQIKAQANENPDFPNLAKNVIDPPASVNNPTIVSNAPDIEASDDENDSVAKNDAIADTPANTALLERPVVVAAPLIADLPKAVFDDSVDNSADESGAVSQSLADGGLSTGFETIRKINIAVTGESNYESLLADKLDVAEQTLIFPDDSYLLGDRNKKILNGMMGNFNPETDVVSVVGCSTGVTKFANGNAALAIGRANRVKEALLYSGIPHDKIYDEGCWSPTANSTPFPNRGVVVTVKRNLESG